jgi:hypothetical protein
MSMFSFFFNLKFSLFIVTRLWPFDLCGYDDKSVRFSMLRLELFKDYILMSSVCV